MGTGPNGTTYMAVEGDCTEMATWATPQTSLSIYWGSIDGNAGGNLNSLAISVDGYTLTGADLVSLGALGTGSQSLPADNQWVTITGLGALRRYRSPQLKMHSSSALALGFLSPRPGP
jgi:hypothetical protein